MKSAGSDTGRIVDPSARAPNDASGPGEPLLAFQLGPKRLALRARDVVEVVRAVAISAVPSGPPVLEGVINVRGRIVPVLDARARLGVEARAASASEHMIVARAGPRTVALRVDRADELITVDDEAILDPAGVAPEVELASGIARLADGVLVVHDLDRFLSAPEGRSVDEAVSAAVESDLGEPHESGPSNGGGA